MAGIIQLGEPIAVETPLGRGYVLLVEFGADEQWWTVLLNDTQAFVTFKQAQIRGVRSYTHGRGISDAEMEGIVSRSAKSKKRKAWYRDYAKRTDKTARDAKRREQTFRRQAARRS